MTTIRSVGAMSKGTLVCSLLVAAMLATLVLAARPDTGVAGGGCDTANVSSSSKRQLKKATICWVNHERTSRGLNPLRKKKKLQRAAGKHLKVMLNKRCFAHKCPGEVGLRRRLAKVGYFRGARAFSFGETLGCAPSAKNMVDRWMQSDPHRKHILDRRFRHIGSAASTKAPFAQCRGSRGTFVHVFGFRKR